MWILPRIQSQDLVMAVRAAIRRGNHIGAALSRPVCARHSHGAAGGSDGESHLDFGNTKEAYRSKSFSELLRHYVVFKAFTFKSLVDNNKAVSLLL